MPKQIIPWKPGPPRGHFSRSRSLEKLNTRFSKGIVEKIIRNALEKQKAVRVLEIGCGEGRVLMELCKLFPQIELYGINKKPWRAMRGRKSLLKTGAYYKIFTPAELGNVKLPKIYFYDAMRLRFPANFFDLVISQVSFMYIERKDLTLEEVWRVLKKNGTALLHIDAQEKNYPDFLQFDTPRFMVYKNGKVITLSQIAAKLRKKGFNIACKRAYKTATTIIMRKNTNKPLSLKLQFDPAASFDLFLVDPDKKRGDIFWGYRSVFKMK